MIIFNTYKDFFAKPLDRKQLLYEALRACYLEKLSDQDICQRYSIKYNSFRSMKRDFIDEMKLNKDPARLFFLESKVGKREKTPDACMDKIIALRNEGLSVPDIKAILSTDGIHISFWKIDKLLKQHNFPRLPRRARKERERLCIPDGFDPPVATQLEFPLHEKFDSLNGSLFLFYPVIKSLQLDDMVKKAGYPQTSTINCLQSILSYLALKLTNTKRLEHSNEYGLDRGLGLFAGLNVLPKNAWFSSYSYRVSRGMNRKLLSALHKRVNVLLPGNGDVNLDFTTLPHWGDESVLENNWSAVRGKGLKSVLALLAQDQGTRLLKYGNAEIKHANQSDAVLEFVDFYKENKEKINCLIFDSKFTTYTNLSKLNGDGIRFITLKRRSEKIIRKVHQNGDTEWELIQLNKKFKRKHRRLWVKEEIIRLPKYEGELRQICIKSQARISPTFLITNDRDISTKEVILKYARRWLVEQDISNQVEFFHLNRLNSSIVVKVDFDLTMSILAETIYRLFSNQITGFEQVKSETLYRNFIKNYAHFEIEGHNIKIRLNKKMHLPLLLELDWFEKGVEVSWLDNVKINFELGSSL